MSLREYHRKRDFKTTREPEGAVGRQAGRLKYVIQKHHASHLHYDFRLEFDGVLKSWAVPKGPSTNPSDKRLAMKVEDHPLDYASFEGTIPEGEYGAGEVEIWDKGFWKSDDPKASVRRALKNGSLKFEILGKKLKGHWALVRMKNAKQDNAWLLMKEKERRPLVQTQVEEGLEPKTKHRPTKLTRTSKILYPEAGITKLDLAEYYVKVADRMLPHIWGRPLMILRCPDGRDHEGFFQKKWNSSLPSSVKKVNAIMSGERAPLLMVDSKEGLLALAQLGVLELHTWGTHFDNIENPDEFIIDLDPHEHVPWNDIVTAAHQVRDEFEKYGMKSFLKATGGKGLHVVAPVLPMMSWELGKEFCRALCSDIARSAPTKYVTHMTKSRRLGRIFLDFFRNSRGSTAIAPYSPRARLDAPIAFPLSWEELDKGMRSDSIHLSDVARRLRPSAKDPWKDFFRYQQVPRIPK